MFVVPSVTDAKRETDDSIVGIQSEQSGCGLVGYFDRDFVHRSCHWTALKIGWGKDRNRPACLDGRPDDSVRRAEECDGRNSQGCSQVGHSRVISDEEPCPPEESAQFGEGEVRISRIES